jgi:hypothetical protein
VPRFARARDGCGLTTLATVRVADSARSDMVSLGFFMNPAAPLTALDTASRTELTTDCTGWTTESSAEPACCPMELSAVSADRFAILASERGCRRRKSF